jgi:hypothetical protein
MSTYNGSKNFPRDVNLTLCKGIALPNNTNKDSSVVDIGAGGFASNVPLAIVIDLPVYSITATKAATIKVLQSSDGGSTWVEAFRKVFAAGDAIGDRWVFGLLDVRAQIKLNYDTTDDLSALTATAYLAPLF